MGDEFKIFVLRLREGQKEKIEESFSPTFLDIHEADLAFTAPVNLEGEAELADETLILHFAIETEATMPCAICNEDVQVKLEIADFCSTIAVEEIKSGTFDFRDVVREAILLELPSRAECNEGNCREREVLAKYLRSE